MAEAYVGQISLIAFDYAPEGWLFCQGQELQVSQYQVLYALIGNKFGGSGTSTFKLPDLRGRVPVQPGTGPLGTTNIWGQVGGTSATTIQGSGSAVMSNVNQLPAHTHAATFTPSGGGTVAQPTITLNVSNDTATSATPVAGGYMAGLKASGLTTPPNAYVATATSGTTALNAKAATATGGSGGGITGGTVTNAMTGAASPQPIPVVVTAAVPAQMPPFIALNYIICVNGYFPPRP